MIKQGMSKLVVVAALVCLFGVGVKAQDVTSDTDNTNVRTVSTSLSIPAAVPAQPAARPAAPHLGMGGLDISTTYSYLNNGYPGYNSQIDESRVGVSGIGIAGTWWLNENIGITADFSDNWGSSKQTTHPEYCDYCTHNLDLDTDTLYVLFGPSFRHRMGKVDIFGHALVGFSRADVTEETSYGVGTPTVRRESLPMNTGFAVGVGGGADYWFSKRIGWRIMQLDYIWSDMNQCSDGSTGCLGTVNNIRLETGILFHIGH